MDFDRAVSQVRNTLAKNPAAPDVFAIFASKTRDYTSVSLRPLWLVLKEKGTPHPVGDVAEVLGALAKAGFGKPKTVKMDGGVQRVVRLTDIPDLREVGVAMVGDSKNLKRFQADRKERNIEGAADTIKNASQTLKIYPMRKASNISITVTINGTPVILPLPDDLKPDQLAALIERLKRVEDGWRK